MRSIRALPALAAVLAMGLSGCVTVFPKTPPVQLYRFDVAAPATPPAASPSDAGFWVERAPTSFAHDAQGDRILTFIGDQAAVIADARWISPAAVLFDEAESHAFDASAGPSHLGRRGEVLSSVVSLRLDVQAFEARYLDGAASAPTVVVQVRASLNRTSDRQSLGVRLFESRHKAEDNRVGAIVPAFSAAVTDVLGQIVTWTDAEGAAVPKS